MSSVNLIMDIGLTITGMCTHELPQHTLYSAATNEMLCHVLLLLAGVLMLAGAHSSLLTISIFPFQ